MKENTKLYNKASEELRGYWNNKFEKNPILPVSSFAKRVYKKIPKNKRINLLDLGCGDGRDSRFFQEKGIKVIGVDYSEVGIRKAMSFHDGIEYLKKDIQAIKYPDNCFDVVYTHLGIHFFSKKETEKIFKKIHRLLKKGGMLFIKVKSTDDKRYGKGKKIEDSIFIDTHIRHFFSKEELKLYMRNFSDVILRKVSSSHQVLKGKAYKASFIEGRGIK